jgi:hypothetical protein
LDYRLSNKIPNSPPAKAIALAIAGRQAPNYNLTQNLKVKSQNLKLVESSKQKVERIIHNF